MNEWRIAKADILFAMNRLFVSLFLLGANGAFAQSASSSDAATIQALLSEVRLLRLALEKSALMAPRIQLTLQRVQLQQDAVTRASRELDEVRDKLASFSRREAELTGRVGAIESQANAEQDAARKKGLESEVRAIKSELEQEGAGNTQLRAREADLASRLQLEQIKLSELNERLNALEQQLQQQSKQP